MFRFYRPLLQFRYVIQAFYFAEETGTRRIATGTSQSTIQIWSSKTEEINTKVLESTPTPAPVTPV